MKRLATLGLALALLFGLAGVALADGGFPAVPTDGVIVTDPLIVGVATDPVSGGPALVNPRWYPSDEGVETAGPGLVGTFIGTSPHLAYVPAFQYQLVYGDPQGGWSCTAYATAMAVDKATYGGSRITGRQLRVLSGAPPNVGLTLPMILRATDTLAVPLVRATGTWADVMLALRAHRGVVLQGDYDVIPDDLSGQPSFDGYHAVFIDRLLSDRSHMYMMDPLLRTGPRWMDESLMRKFAEKLSRQEGIYPRVLFAYTRPARLFH